MNTLYWYSQRNVIKRTECCIEHDTQNFERLLYINKCSMKTLFVYFFSLFEISNHVQKYLTIDYFDT